jgi:HPt (histidine-containing phosphotransfer) domain-containing protein
MQIPRELKIKYLERRKLEIDHLNWSLDNDDFGPALKLGHQVKGNAKTFECPQIAPLGQEIESAAKNKDKDMIRKLIQKMSFELQLASQQFLH